MGFPSQLRRIASALLIVASLCGPASFCYAQTAKTTTLVIPGAPLLPQSFGAWQSAATAAPCRDCFQPQGQTADVIREDSLQRASQLSYKRQHGAGELEITAYQFRDATGALSAFTYLRKPGSRLVISGNSKVGSEMAATGRGDYIFRSGTTVVIADAGKANGPVVSDLRALEISLPKIGGPRAQSPLLPTLLPAKGLEAETVRYALGPVGYQAMGGMLPPDLIGFDKSAEVIMAKYQGRGTLTLLLYPTPQLAGNYGRAIAAEMNRQGADAGTVKLRREGPLLSLTTGAWTPESAQKMVESVHLHDILTWNKTPPLDFKIEVRKTVSLLTSIAILSGLLALAAIVLGLFFGFGRAAIRVLQGKPAATEPEFLRIDLSGRSEKIRLEEHGEAKS